MLQKGVEYDDLLNPWRGKWKCAPTKNNNILLQAEEKYIFTKPEADNSQFLVSNEYVPNVYKIGINN